MREHAKEFLEGKVINPLNQKLNNLQESMDRIADAVERLVESRTQSSEPVKVEEKKETKKSPARKKVKDESPTDPGE